LCTNEFSAILYLYLLIYKGKIKHMFKKLMRKIATPLVALSLLALVATPAIVSAQQEFETDPATIIETQFGLEEYEGEVALGQDISIQETIARIINILLGFLGIIAVIIILAGGFKWMTAGGNEDKIGEARKMIVQGLIGLVVIFASWAIASFVINLLMTATNV
jgi:type IV secretory pathway VirB2 component (pilin)